ncbi:hypothetical protein K6Y31_00795 [Motilimonas cestriensis]|uniref:Uncharacterized protein n=1 Tax=Motilimonas cestriensis TaxID=2742685 RepID=A0ABS8W362_9GAMM|nr:hypothetical protein [Motilimonas cestriensis]MCE2593356.1 hypothetical protein [Motilimonas cestriensis]
MFEIANSSPFFELMHSEEPLLVQNIEVVNDNKINMDISYHNPKKFILELNNLLKSTIFFVETAMKNSPDWLRNSVKDFRESNIDEYEILKNLRNTSAHQSLVFPNESLSMGLYRVQSEIEYKQKIGIGDHEKPGKYSWDLAFKNTNDLFHDVLVFQSIAFMDLEHSALWECLGITRRWFFHVKFKNRDTTFDEVIDVYKLICNFSTKLLDQVCNDYAKLKDLKFSQNFHAELPECNFVNTILEIDLYPSLFCKWWEIEVEPLNFGILATINEANQFHWINSFHTNAYDNLMKNSDEYISQLESIIKLEPKEIYTEEHALKVFSFIKLNHWHVKSAFNASLMDTPVDIGDIMRIQRLGKIFMDEYAKKKQCTISSSYQSFRSHLQAVHKNLTSALNGTKTVG